MKKAIKTILLSLFALVLTAGVTFAAYPDTFTTFVAGTVISSTWLNSVENLLGLDPAKGSLLVGSSTTAGAWVAVGSDGKILTASSTATYGVSWETSTGLDFVTTTINGVKATTFTFATSGTTGLSISTSTNTLTFTIATSSGSQAGFLSSSDWTTFNNKQATISFPLAVASTSLTAGAGLTLTTNDLAVGAGTNIVVNADDVAVTSTPAFTSLKVNSNTVRGEFSVGASVINTTTSVPFSKELFRAATITNFYCSTNGSTINFSADERVSSTPNTHGTNIFASTSVACDSDGFTTTTFSNAGIAAGNLLTNYATTTGPNASTTLNINWIFTND